MTFLTSTDALTTGPDSFVMVPWSDPFAICGADGNQPNSNSANVKIGNFAQRSINASAPVGSASVRPNPGRGGNDGQNLCGPQARQGGPFSAVRIVGGLAFVTENHRRAGVRVESRPMRQPLMIRIAVAGEGRPGSAHLFLKRIAVLTGSGHRFPFVHVFQDEGNLQRVERLQLAVAD